MFKTAKNDNISRPNSRPKLPFPGNGKGNLKLPWEGKFEACIPGNHGKREFPLTPASAWEIIWEWAPRPFAQICAEKIYIKRQKTSVRLLSTAVLQFGPMAGRLLWLRLVTGKRQFNAKAPKCVSWVEHWAGSRRLRVEQPRNLFLSSSCSSWPLHL